MTRLRYTRQGWFFVLRYNTGYTFSGVDGKRVQEDRWTDVRFGPYPSARAAYAASGRWL